MWLLWISHEELFLLAAAWGKATGMKQCTCLKTDSPQRPKIQNNLCWSCSLTFFCCCIFFNLTLACWSKGCRLTLTRRVSHLPGLEDCTFKKPEHRGGVGACGWKQKDLLREQQPLFISETPFLYSCKIFPTEWSFSECNKKKSSTSIENKCIKLRAWQTGAPKTYNRTNKQTKKEK